MSWDSSHTHHPAYRAVPTALPVGKVDSVMAFWGQKTQDTFSPFGLFLEVNLLTYHF